MCACYRVDAIFRFLFCNVLAQVFICNLFWVAIEPGSFLQPATFRQVLFVQLRNSQGMAQGFFFATQGFFFCNGKVLSATARFLLPPSCCRDSPCPWCYKPLYLDPPNPPPHGVHPGPGARKKTTPSRVQSWTAPFRSPCM